ncbi:hypothetical protein ACSVDA_21535 [Cytobacillus sp. Hm23]
MPEMIGIIFFIFILFVIFTSAMLLFTDTWDLGIFMFSLVYGLFKFDSFFSDIKLKQGINQLEYFISLLLFREKTNLYSFLAWLELVIMGLILTFIPYVIKTLLRHFRKE